MCFNAQGIQQQLRKAQSWEAKPCALTHRVCANDFGDPKSKTNIYCMNLKQCLELRNKELFKTGLKRQEMSNISAEIFMQYVIRARK